MNDDLLKELLIALKVLAGANPPNWQRPLKTYKDFDWTKIGATVVSHDAHGATKVVWCGHVYTRRSGENRKFGATIWFSRSTGKGDNDETHYLKLITFKDAADAETLPDYVVKCLKQLIPHSHTIQKKRKKPDRAYTRREPR